ncbi:MAG: DUF167 family protein [bacterium]
MYIKIRTKAGAKKEEVTAESADHFLVSVRQKAERNMANTRVLEIFRTRFPGKSVRLISGHHSPSKIISVD